MLPLQLRLRNYCQHRNLTVDFTQGNLIGITAPNGSGKSNVLHGLRFALTGEKTGEKLTDDIFDGSNYAEVELDLEINPTTRAKVKRTIDRKTANSASLEIRSLQADGSWKLTQNFVKSSDAMAQFEQYLGVDPKSVCEIIIARQHSIDSLLFDKSTKRNERFEKFLQGKTFVDRVEQLKEEQDRLHVDILATERLRVLEEELAKLELEVHTNLSTRKRLDNFLNSSDVKRLLQKQELLRKHAELRVGYQRLVENRQRVLTSMAQKQAQLQLIPVKLVEQLPMWENDIRTWDAQNVAWSAYESYCTQRAQLEAQISSLLPQVTGLREQVERSRSAKEQLPLWQEHQLQYNYRQDVARWNAEILPLSAQSAQLEKDIALQIQNSEQVARDLQSTVTDLKTFTEAAALLASQHDHAKDCPVCGRDMDNSVQPRLQQKIVCLRPIQTQQAAELARVQALIVQLRNQILPITRRITECTTLIAQRQPSITTTALPELDAVVKKIQELTPLSNLFSVLEPQYQQCNQQLIQAQARLQGLTPVPQATKPQMSSEQISQLRSQVVLGRTQLNEQQQLRGYLQGAETEMLHTDQQITLLTKSAKEATLPELNTVWSLTGQESQLAAEVLTTQGELQTHLQTMAAASRAVEQRKKDIAQTQLSIVGAKDTIAYRDHLGSVIQVFNEIPQQILLNQLLVLCRKVDDIIKDFKVQQPFKLDVDADLDFLLRYDNGRTRSITRASGGERIMLGLAFRLATHSIFAQQFPFIAIDEPTNHLDEQNVPIVAALFRTLSSNMGKYGLQKIIYCTHSRDVASQADRVITL